MTSAMLHALVVPMTACRKMTSSRFGQAHQQRVEPFGRKSADRAEEDREQRRNDGRADADEQRQPPAVPDHREDIAPHRVRAEQELAARRSGAVSKVEIRRVLRHDKLAEKAREHDERQNHSGDDRLAAQGMSVFRGCGLRQRSRADDLKAVVHGCASVSRTACSARIRGSICSLIVWAMMLHRMTSAPESRLSSISRL